MEMQQGDRRVWFIVTMRAFKMHKVIQIGGKGLKGQLCLIDRETKADLVDMRLLAGALQRPLVFEEPKGPLPPVGEQLICEDPRDA